MARFSEVFRLNKKQAELDFVDVDLTTDTPLYICPYAIQIRDDEWSSKCGDYIRSFFNELLDVLRDDDIDRAMHLLSNLHEPNETFLGQSKGRPRGRAIGQVKARQLAEAIINSRAFETGLLSDVSDAALYIYGVGRDTISDLTTNVLRGILAEYTAAQCELHDVPTQPVRSIGPIWNLARRDWQATTLNLPVANAEPILLIPKSSVRYRLSVDTQEFYNFHMLEFLQEEYLYAGGALVKTFKDGRRYVTKKSVEERHPFNKDDLAAFVRTHPEVLETYKNLKGARGVLSSEELELFFDEKVFAEALIHRLNEIPTGNASASAYHTLAMGICTFLFHPELTYPVKEHEIHDGRKRVDIKYTNAAERGFFLARMEAAQTRAVNVMMECKNYSEDPGNPEFDQLAQRFGHQRGFLGFLLCRQVEDRERALERCRDTVRDGRGYMMLFEDADLIEFLTFVSAGQRPRIDFALTARFEQLIA